MFPSLLKGIVAYFACVLHMAASGCENKSLSHPGSFFSVLSKAQGLGGRMIARLGAGCPAFLRTRKKVCRQPGGILPLALFPWTCSRGETIEI